MRVLRKTLFGLFLVIPAVGFGANCNVTSVGLTPITDFGAGETYLGFEGGLYPGEANVRPAAHDAAGLARAQAIQPLDANGNPDPNGSYVLVSIGMSNTNQEFGNSFVPLANADPDKDPNLVIVNGAQGGQSARVIVDPNAAFWSTIEDRLASNGVTPEQVVVAWVKQANQANNADEAAYRTELQGDLEEIARILKDKYPNIQLAYYSSRIYAGYADTDLNPEPYAYDSGFTVKWAIEKQIDGDPSLNVDDGTAPWLSWGPYMWADGMIPRGDGLTWACDELAGDGTHPSNLGTDKVANLLLDFFKTDTTAREWYLTSPGAAPDTIAPAGPTNLTVE